MAASSDSKLIDNTTCRLIATSAAGLEAVVSRELSALGYDNQILSTGRIAFAGGLDAIVKTNLWLRSADRVLLEIGRFEATDFGVLFDRTKALPWGQWIPAEAYFPVNGRSVKSQLSSVPACQRVVKKAIAERLTADHGGAKLSDQRDAPVQCIVEVAIRENEVCLTLDTTGDGLHKRGYRRKVGAAPLKETLAAGLLQLSFWRKDRALLDPFCGSGTLPIEAAMIGRNIAPGLNRSFISETWPRLDASLWQVERIAARSAMLDKLPVRIIGTDIDDEALDLAREHAKLAGVADDIHFQRRDFRDLAAKQHYGCLITNPPYGERLGYDDERALNDLYASMPTILAKLKTWSHYILTAYPDFEKVIGQDADRRRKLYNAQIQCTYYQFHGPHPNAHPHPPHAQAKAEHGMVNEQGNRPAKAHVEIKPAFGGLPERSKEQAVLFGNRLAKNAKHLSRWPSKRGITCYRLYDRDVPEIPLVVDRYEDHLHLAEYERPHEHTAAQHDEWLDLLVKTAAEVTNTDVKKVFLKRRRKQRGDTQHERVATDEHMITVQEGGLKFRVNLSDYIDTGLFLDHRLTRQMVRERVKGKRFLNLFAYTGSFTVYAAAGGAASTTTVDLSNTYLDWAAANLKLNGVDVNDERHRFIRSDTMDYLNAAADQVTQENEKFELAVVDPPTFSNSKRNETIWDVQRDHVALLTQVGKVMAPGGLVYFSTNFRRFKLEESALLSEGGYKKFHEISKQTVPGDFRNKRIHRCWAMQLA